MTELELLNLGIVIIQEKYGQLSNQCQKELKKNFKVLHLEKGQVVVKSGQYSNHLYFLFSGSARAYYLKDGREITDWFAFEHDFICAINSFFLGIPSPHYIASIEPAIVGLITSDDMTHLCNSYHEFEHVSRLITTEVMLKLQQRIVALQFESALQKYENLLLKYPDITKKVALGHIASYLGITLETLSRIRNERRTNLI